MNILITGATGFIGGNVLAYLSGKGHFCRCLIRERSRIGGLRNRSNVEWFQGDLARRETLKGICKGVDVVIHCAGVLGRWNSTMADLNPVNAMGILNLSGEMLKNEVQFVLHLSAGGITGPVEGDRRMKHISAVRKHPMKRRNTRAKNMHACCMRSTMCHLR